MAQIKNTTKTNYVQVGLLTEKRAQLVKLNPLFIKVL